jgi:hypothetical protein
VGTMQACSRDIATATSQLMRQPNNTSFVLNTLQVTSALRTYVVLH